MLQIRTATTSFLVILWLRIPYAESQISSNTDTAASTTSSLTTSVELQTGYNETSMSTTSNITTAPNGAGGTETVLNTQKNTETAGLMPSNRTDSTYKTLSTTNMYYENDTSTSPTRHTNSNGTISGKTSLETHTNRQYNTRNFTEPTTSTYGLLEIPITQSALTSLTTINNKQTSVETTTNWRVSSEQTLANRTQNYTNYITETTSDNSNETEINLATSQQATISFPLMNTEATVTETSQSMTVFTTDLLSERPPKGPEPTILPLVVIIGASAGGGMLLLIIVIVLLVCLVRNKKKSKRSSTYDDGDYHLHSICRNNSNGQYDRNRGNASARTPVFLDNYATIVSVANENALDLDDLYAKPDKNTSYKDKSKNEESDIIDKDTILDSDLLQETAIDGNKDSASLEGKIPNYTKSMKSFKPLEHTKEIESNPKEEPTSNDYKENADTSTYQQPIIEDDNEKLEGKVPIYSKSMKSFKPFDHINKTVLTSEKRDSSNKARDTKEPVEYPYIETPFKTNMNVTENFTDYEQIDVQSGEVIQEIKPEKKNPKRYNPGYEQVVLDISDSSNKDDVQMIENEVYESATKC